MISPTLASTICAPATAQGGAIGVIRLSGPQAIDIIARIFHPMVGEPIERRASHTLTFGRIFSTEGDLLDEVLVSLFRAPHSYTGEECVEISCHGSAYIMREILTALTATGARMAEPGEFTKRAFANRKMDLSQAEAVADLIASDSAAQHRVALQQMRGGFSQKLHELHDALVRFSALIELELDFSDHEDIEFADRTELQHLADKVYDTITHLADSFRAGNAIKQGVPVAIIGDANAGKSTLLNNLLNEEKAIVSHIAGTTRDIIEDTINLSGTTFRFIDTAGIRQTDNEIEAIGIQRTLRKLEEAAIVIWVLDVTNPQFEHTLIDLSDLIKRHLKEAQLIVLLNKCDIGYPVIYQRAALYNELYTYSPLPRVIPFSNKSRRALDRLKATLNEFSALPALAKSDIVITNLRHYEALRAAQQAIGRVRTALAQGIPGDLLAQDIRECSHHLSDILGEVTSDSILQSVFRNFCIGK